MPIFLYPPDDVEDGWYEELIVNGHSHVTWLVEGRGYGADSVAQVHAPQQEQELRWEKQKRQTTDRSQRRLEDTTSFKVVIVFNFFFLLFFLY